ncbi:multidrug efflux SMR transporter [Morganella sp. Je.2.23]|uniref:DMT family transporter n=1 Tax=Morganella sp. Je.2.23 TaxID=3142840 RepID=UPI003DA8085B
MKKYADNKLKKSWGVLFLAGIFEVGYALSVAGSHAFTKLNWSILALVFFILTLYTLSISLKYINVGVGYAVWAGIGTIGASIFGFVLFHQQLSLIQIFWLVIIIIGVIWLKISDSN